jgi:hypothetical protein
MVPLPMQSKYVAYYIVCFPKIQVQIFKIADFFVFPGILPRVGSVLHHLMQNRRKKPGGK